MRQELQGGEPPPCPRIALRCGINSALGDSFLPQRRQEVQGGESPPCLRIALSRDLALAFMQSRICSRLPLLWAILGADPVLARLVEPMFGLELPLVGFLGPLCPDDLVCTLTTLGVSSNLLGSQITFHDQYHSKNCTFALIKILRLARIHDLMQQYSIMLLIAIILGISV